MIGGFSRLMFRARAVLVVGTLLVLGVVSAAAANYKVVPSSMTFPGVTLVGLKSGSQTVTVTNTGTSNISITSFSLTPFYVFQLDYGYTRTLAPGSQALFGIKFVPAQGISYNGNFLINFSDGTSINIPITGKSGTTGAIATISPNIVNFPPTPVGTTASQTITVTNTGTTKMFLNTIDAQPPFSQKGLNKSTEIDAGKSFSFTLSFRPMAAIPYANSVALLYDVLPQNSIAVTATGTPPTVPVIYTYPTLPSATQRAAYNAVLNATGGTAPYTFTMGTGSVLPAGLSLSSDGIISGTISDSVTTGQYHFTINAKDSAHPAKLANIAATLSVGLPTGGLCNAITSYVPNSNNVPMVAMTDLGTNTYLGVQGGLYGSGSNVRPPAHDAAGLSIAQGIGPLDSNGNPDPNGQYAMLVIGVSVTRTIMNQFQPLEQADPVLHPQFQIVNGAIDGTTGPDWADPNSGVWQTVLNYYLPYQNLSPKQIVAAYALIPHPGKGPGKTFPADLANQESDLTNLAKNLHTYFPNLKLAYLSSTFYGGYSASSYPEPNPYESGYAHAAVIEDQISGDPNLNYNPANGPVMAPWLSWGPYVWANGLNPRSDGLTWSCQDIAGDGTHPSSPQGRDKAAGLIITDFKFDDTIAPWFLNAQSQPKK
jgi:hypothetical protein